MIYIIFITLALLIIMILVKNFTNKTNNTATEFINKTNNVYTLNSAVIPDVATTIIPPTKDRDNAWYNSKYNSFSAKSSSNRNMPFKSIVRKPNSKYYKRVVWRNNVTRQAIDNAKLFPFIDSTTGKDLENSSKISNMVEESKGKREALSKKREQQETKPTKLGLTQEQAKKRMESNALTMYTTKNAHETAKLLYNTNVYKGSDKNTNNLLRRDNAFAGRRNFNYITGKYEDEDEE